MKKIIIKSVLAVAATVFATSNMSAQITTNSLGFKAGYQMSSLNSHAFENSVSGFNTGMTFVHSKSANYGWGADLLYARSGGTYTRALSDGMPQSRTVMIDQIRFIPKGYLFFGDRQNKFRPKLFVGPAVSFLLAANDQTSSANYNSQFTTASLEGVLGAGFNYEIKEAFWLVFDTEYALGLTDVNTVMVAHPEGLQNNIFSVNLGLAFGFPVKEIKADIEDKID